ncbi:MAG: chorismate synthase [Bacilli bacterium]|jgi:chorismate synthase|nr:chorismate synthase [Bacilli bacterium]
MKSKFISNYQIELIGQSHDDFFTIAMNNVKSGYLINIASLDLNLKLRSPHQVYNTKRIENSHYEIISGLERIDDNYYQTNGQLLKIKFFNNNTKSNDYEALKYQYRPGHIDYIASLKDHNHHLAGGGHFSGRLTEGLVFIGSICEQILKKDNPNLDIFTHVLTSLGIKDDAYYDLKKHYFNNVVAEYLSTYQNQDLLKLAQEYHNLVLKRLYQYQHQYLNEGIFMINVEQYHKLINKIDESLKTTFNGHLETIIINPPALLGQTWFNSLESKISQFMYAIPGIKGVIFGNYQHDQLGCDIQEQYLYYDDKQALTYHNYNGGINGGLSNGEDIVFTSILKPLASTMMIFDTYNFKEKKITPLNIAGRHDQTIINRVIPIINACTYLALYDEILVKS